MTPDADARPPEFAALEGPPPATPRPCAGDTLYALRAVAGRPEFARRELALRECMWELAFDRALAALGVAPEDMEQARRMAGVWW